MIGLIKVLILGVIEGLSEFLPISSTFHLLVATKILGLTENEFVKVFVVVIQMGAILAVVWKYRQKIWKKEVFIPIFWSFLPTALIGLALHKTIKNIFFEQSMWQLIVFATVGVVFLVVRQTKTDDKKVTFLNAIIIGIIQALAVVPGVSRAGAVMVGMSLLGYNKKQAAEYSFLLAVPTILAAGVLDIYKGKDIIMTTYMAIPELLVGSVVAFVSALLVIDWFISFNQEKGLRTWGWYRIVVACGLFLSGVMAHL